MVDRGAAMIDDTPIDDMRVCAAHAVQAAYDTANSVRYRGYGRFADFSAVEAERLLEKLDQAKTVP